MKTNVLVYISGPMTANDGRTIEQNTADGVAVFLDLLQRGIPAFSPHLSGAFPSAWTALTHQQWIDYDFAIIDRCTHMLMMPRWKKSKGASLEFEYAMDRRTPIAFSVEELVEQLTVRNVSAPSMGGTMNDEQDKQTEEPTGTTGDVNAGTTDEQKPVVDQADGASGLKDDQPADETVGSTT